MITECYIKGRFDYGVGKCAVVIVENNEVVCKAAWKVPAQWDYEGETIEADQYSCEILAATYALQWCVWNGRKLVNIYANTMTSQKWYFRGDFPDTRKAQGKAYLDLVDALQRQVGEKEGKPMSEVVYADYIPKDSDNEFNRLVNELAENAK